MECWILINVIEKEEKFEQNYSKIEKNRRKC